MAQDEAVDFDQQDEVEESSAGTKRSGGFLSRILIFSAIGIVLIALFFLIAYLTFQALGSSQKVVTGTYHTGLDVEKPRTEEFDLTEREDMRITLDPERGSTRPTVIRTKIALKIPKDTEAVKGAITEHLYEIRETIETTIAKKTAKELESKDGLINLKLELESEINHILGDNRIMDVIITNFDVISQQ